METGEDSEPSVVPVIARSLPTQTSIHLTRAMCRTNANDPYKRRIAARHNDGTPADGTTTFKRAADCARLAFRRIFAYHKRTKPHTWPRLSRWGGGNRPFET